MNYNNFTVPSGTDFDRSVYEHLKRIQSVTLNEKHITSSKEYCINGMVYSVNSVFSRESKCSVDHKLRYLMQKETEKLS